MRPHPPPYQAPPPPRPSGNWFTRGGWYYLVQLVSMGMLLVWPLTHAAIRSRRRWQWIAAVGVVVWLVVAMTIFSSAPMGPTNTRVGPMADLGGTMMLVNFLAGFALIAVARAQAFPRGGGRPGDEASGARADPAMAAALAARKRRAEARKIVADDHLLARDLKIGRPDLRPTYDDGGLVDLNSAPPEVIAGVCGLAPAQAGAIVQARQAAGRFGSVEDVFAWTELPYDTWERIRDRAVTV